jgi:hypothetical protein
MDDLWTVIADELSDRVSGPLKFRIVLQPLVATFLAVRAGLRDAKTGRPPYFWSLLVTPGHRMEIIKDGWKSVGRLFLLAFALDVVYQLLVESSLHLRASILVAFFLAIVPYVILRGPVTRIASALRNRSRTVSGTAPVAKTPRSSGVNDHRT